MTTAIPTADAGPDASPRARSIRAGFRGVVPSGAAVAAWGAGLIELALGAGALTNGGAARGAGAVLVALGAAALVWGAATLVRGRIIVPRTGVAASLAGLAAAVAALAADPVRTSLAAIGALAVLLLATALACASRVRRRGGRADAAPPRVWAILAASAVVAALVTPALAATDAGRSAVPHGRHGITDPGHH